MGWTKYKDKDLAKTLTRLDMSPPRTITGREASYRYTNSGYTAKLHTTYLEKESKWRDSGTDSGWVLIVEGDTALYFARPFKRTANFITNLLSYAWVTKWKVDNRHICPVCQSYMDIHRKPETRQYFWICRKSAFHPISQKPEFLDWDYGLPKKAQEFVNIRRDATARYKAKNVELGIKPTPAAKIRKTWRISKPQNKI